MKTRYFYGYNIVAAGFTIQAVCIGALFAYGVFFKEIQAEFGWSRATISGASSLALLMMGAAGVLAGRLNDRIGPRILIAVSAVFLGLGYLLLSRIQSPWQLYVVFGILAGIGFSTHDVITLSTVARWFDKRRGAMSGIVKVGTGSGQLLGPMLATLLLTVFGWRYSNVIIGAAILVALLLVAQLMRRDPQEMGLLPDGRISKSNGRNGEVTGRSLILREAARIEQFWTICITEFAIFFCLFTIVVHIVPHARDLGLAPAYAAGVLSTIGGVSIVGRIVMGSANDRIGGKRALLICIIMLFCSFVWLQLASTAWMLFLFAVIYGFAHGGFFTVVSPMVAEWFGTGSHGMLFGIVLFCGTLGGSVGPLVAGRIFDVTGSYQMVFLILTGLTVIGFALMMRLRPVRVREL
ncbi:MAG: MFS transporter [Desulfobacterales bacterium]|nr:MFS transporter [Desulfobacterales bacterium]